ncbi:MAG TPA: hypothetical protein VET65_00745 [Candidatus Limnocylindrales bacterium]|nr:hypothetical protein [Candidatus Limnocylindrales bacterium]
MSGAVTAADSQWSVLGLQVPGSVDRPVWSLAISPAHPAIMLQATQGRGVLRSSDSGATWSPVLTADSAAWVVHFDPQQPTVVYAGTPTQGLWRSADEGKSWVRAGQGLDPDVRAIDVAPGLVLAGTAHGVYYSTDAAASWHSLGLATLAIAAVAVIQDGSTTTLFAGADNGTAGGYLQTSTGLSGAWSIVHGNFPADATLATIAVGPAPSGSTGHSIFAGTSQGLYRSDDTGASWNPVAGLPQADVNAVSINPWSGDQIYVGSDGDQGQGGVFRSLDHGSTWTPLAGTGFPHRPRVTALALQPGPALLVLADTWNPTTNEIGLYRIPDTAAATSASSNPVTSPTARATALPTPQPRTASSQAHGTGGFELPVAARTLGIGAAVAIVLVLALVVRRWRMRRQDLQTYRR